MNASTDLQKIKYENNTIMIKNIKNPIVKLNRYNNPTLLIKREI